MRYGGKTLKKNVMKNIEKIKSNRTIPLEVKKELSDKIISNFAMSTSFLILALTYYIASFYITRDAAELIYKISAGVFIIFTVIVFERAYKFDSGAKAIAGIELLAFSMFSLFAPFIFFTFEPQYLSMMILGMTFYYIIKILITYTIGKNKALKSNDDINVIIKKESQDAMAKTIHNTRRKRIEPEEEEIPKIRTVISAKRAKQAAAKAKAAAAISSSKSASKTKTAASRTRQLVEEDRNKKAEEIKPKKETTKKKTTAKTTAKPKTTAAKEKAASKELLEKKVITKKSATKSTDTTETKKATTKAATKTTKSGTTKKSKTADNETKKKTTKKTATEKAKPAKKSTDTTETKKTTVKAATKSGTTKKATSAKTSTKDEKGTTRKRTTKKGEE